MSDIIYRAEVKNNQKIPIPDDLRVELTRDEADTVRWNYHKEEEVVVLSNRALEPPTYDAFQFVWATKLLDGGRYVRPPDRLPRELLSCAWEDDRPLVEVLAERRGQSPEEVRDSWRDNAMFGENREEFGALEQPQRPFVYLVSWPELLDDDPRFVFLVCDGRLQELMAGGLKRQLHTGGSTDELVKLRSGAMPTYSALEPVLDDIE